MPRTSLAETLEYGVNNIDAEVVWGDSEGATTVMPGRAAPACSVAVLDTGVDCAHEDLAGGCVHGANFASAGEPFDDHGHGTHVAGIIGARANGVGTIGVAPKSTVYAVKVMNAQRLGAWSWVAAGIDWAVDNAMRRDQHEPERNPWQPGALADAVAAAQAARRACGVGSGQ